MSLGRRAASSSSSPPPPPPPLLPSPAAGEGDLGLNMWSDKSPSLPFPRRQRGGGVRSEELVDTVAAAAVSRRDDDVRWWWWRRCRRRVGGQDTAAPEVANAQNKPEAPAFAARTPEPPGSSRREHDANKVTNHGRAHTHTKTHRLDARRGGDVGVEVSRRRWTWSFSSNSKI